MIKNNFSRILGERKMKVSEASRKLEIPYQKLLSIYKDQSKIINIEDLNKICNFFSCSTQDIFEFVQDENK